MTDLSPLGRAESDLLPPPTLYDPADDHETPPATETTGTVIVLLVGDAGRRWAAQTAIELSTAWARKGRRVVLADLHFENPILHESIGDENLEGVVDVFLYGVSIARSARPVLGRGFYLIPAGTYTADLDAIYHHSRWPKLASGFRDADASLVLFVPAEGSDLEQLSRWASEAIVLGNLADATPLTHLSGAGIPIRAHIVEPSDAPARPSSEPLPAAPVPAAPRPAVADEALHLPPPPVRTGPRKRRMLFLLWLVLAVVGLAIIGYLVGRLRPDLLPWPGGIALRGGADSTVSVVSPAAAVPVPPTRGGEPLPFSVHVIAFQSLPAALQRLSVDRERVTSAPVFLAPEEIDGILYYKILAGALPDTATARQLKERLVSDGVVNEEDAAGSWTLVQHNRLAFQLGEYPNAEAAQAAADSLLTRNIPAYPVPVPYSDSTRRWQLYAGAYRDSSSASALRTLLASAGLEAALVERSGLSAPPPR